MARPARVKPDEHVGPGLYVVAWLFGLLGLALLLWWALAVWGGLRT